MLAFDWLTILINVLRSIMWAFMLQDHTSKDFWFKGFITAMIFFTIFTDISALEKKIQKLKSTQNSQEYGRN